MSAKEQSRENVGKIIEIKGVVIDAVFPDRLPRSTPRSQIEIAEQDGNDRAR